MLFLSDKLAAMTSASRQQYFFCLFDLITFGFLLFSTSTNQKSLIPL